MKFVFSPDVTLLWLTWLKAPADEADEPLHMEWLPLPLQNKPLWAPSNPRLKTFLFPKQWTRRVSPLALLFSTVVT